MLRESFSTGQVPLDRFLGGPTVGRPSPEQGALQRAFRTTVPQRIAPVAEHRYAGYSDD